MYSLWTTLIFVLATITTPVLCQSGDGEWGSGSGRAETNGTSQVTAGDEPLRTDANVWGAAGTLSPPLLYHPQPDKCSLHFSTCTTSSHSLRAQREEMDHLWALQHGNEEVLENLVQVVGEEMGDQRYEDVIKENIIVAQEERKSCHEALEKAEEDLKKQLEGEVLHALTGMQKIREESSSIQEMFRAAADIASRLESSSQRLHTLFTKRFRETIS